MGIKKEKTEVRKEQITKAAIDIIGREGAQGFTTARVAKEVGISEANLYRHFKNKDAIISSVIDSIEETLLGNFESIRRERISAIEKLERIFKLHLQYIQENNGIPRIVFSSEVLFVKGLNKKLLSLVNRYMGMLGDVLEEGALDGSIKPKINAEAMAGMYVGMIQFNAMRWLLGGFKYSLIDKSEKLWESYKKYVENKKMRSER